jgi:hypothetical protein
MLSMLAGGMVRLLLLLRCLCTLRPAILYNNAHEQ